MSSFTVTSVSARPDQAPVHVVPSGDGDHRLLCNDLGNVLQVGRKAAEQKIRELRRNGFHAYPLRFAPSIYFVGIAETPAKALALHDLFEIQRAAIRRILAAEAPEGPFRA